LAATDLAHIVMSFRFKRPGHDGNEAREREKCEDERQRLDHAALLFEPGRVDGVNGARRMKVRIGASMSIMLHSA
jgi:hypothetical protein